MRQDLGTNFRVSYIFVSDLSGTAAAASSLVDLSLVDLATSFVLGDGDLSLFGFTMQVVDDLDGDGALEVLVREPFLTESTDAAGNTITTAEDIIWVISGAELASPSTSSLDMDTIRIQEFEYEIDGAETGSSLESSDLDGDGKGDLLISIRLPGFHYRFCTRESVCLSL